MITPIKPTEKNIETISSAIYQVLKSRGSNALAELLEVEPNPFKGECYIASALLYECFDGKGMTLYRKKDVFNDYHWWIKTDEGKTIDLTSDQYTIEDLEVPSSNYDGAEPAKPMWFPSYKQRIKDLRKELDHHMKTNQIQIEL